LVEGRDICAARLVLGLKAGGRRPFGSECRDDDAVARPKTHQRAPIVGRRPKRPTRARKASAYRAPTSS
jgi:hypothetical protein